MSTARLTPAEQIEQSYDDAMIALADYLTRDCDAETTVGPLRTGCSFIASTEAIGQEVTSETVNYRVSSG